MVKAAQLYTLTCDTCGFIINSNPGTKFSDFIKDISNKGWYFETNYLPYDPDKIKKVTCPKCEEKHKAELCKSEDIRDRIIGGYYENDRQFKTDALAFVGLTNHPKAEKAFEIAWEHGHAEGYGNVLCWLEELADLLE